MRKIYLSLLITFFAVSAQDRTYGTSANLASIQPKANAVSRTLEPCNTIVINDTEEENGVFISGMSG